LAGGFRVPPVARVRAERKQIRTNSLIFLNSVPEMQQIAAKYTAPAGIPSEQKNFCNLTGNPPLLKNSLSAASSAASSRARRENAEAHMADTLHSSPHGRAPTSRRVCRPLSAAHALHHLAVAHTRQRGQFWL
jgi:hypothetical protein